MITFHLLEKAFLAVFSNGMRDVVVSRNEVKPGDIIRLVSDDINRAVQTQVSEVTHHEKHADLMTISISDITEIDYDICD